MFLCPVSPIFICWLNMLALSCLIALFFRELSSLSSRFASSSPSEFDETSSLWPKPEPICSSTGTFNLARDGSSSCYGGLIAAFTFYASSLLPLRVRKMSTNSLSCLLERSYFCAACPMFWLKFSCR